MICRQPWLSDWGYSFVHAAVVLHRAASERIHAQINGVVPGGEPREVADDFDLAQLRHDAKVLTDSGAEELCSVNLWNVEFGEAIGLLARRGLLEDQPFVLVDVGAYFAGRAYELLICHC
jgi:hypothetical protein